MGASILRSFEEISRIHFAESEGKYAKEAEAAVERDKGVMVHIDALISTIDTLLE